jgi:GNAT superfamily N-acetyltransferase
MVDCMMQRTQDATDGSSARQRGLEELAQIRDALRPGHGAGSEEVGVRALQATDGAAIDTMVRRCSDDTLRRRFHGSAGPLQRRRAVELLLDGRVEALVAVTPAADVVGVATAHRSRVGAVELAVLVEDDWQSAGIGHRLTAALIACVRRLGFSVAVADVLRQPAFVLDGLVRHQRGATVDYDGPVATVRIPLEASTLGRLPGAAVS